ncbi:MAG: RNA polymerase-binding protein DksA [Gammaproteobacteria bacterium]|nr:MAG: RNA polymerase-binding protein DksA [Gammaproteobacteria bacterium]
MTTEKQLLAQPKKNYMNEGQLAFFTTKLTTLREEIKVHTTSIMNELSSQEHEFDELDIATNQEENRMRLRLLDRERKLLPKIEKSLTMIGDGSYGYCAETGEQIGLLRLLIRPTATLCAEEKNRQEHIEKGYRK